MWYSQLNAGWNSKILICLYAIMALHLIQYFWSAFSNTCQKPQNHVFCPRNSISRHLQKYITEMKNDTNNNNSNSILFIQHLLEQCQAVLSVLQHKCSTGSNLCPLGDTWQRLETFCFLELVGEARDVVKHLHCTGQLPQ